MMIFITGIDCG